jgi:hypothetical protein
VAEPQHSKILSAAARETLKPIGLQRKGRSRIWLDDNGWWAGVVEFQPSSWSRGSYLNVGAMWLWHPPPHHISFDVDHRVGEAGYIEYESDDQFAPLAQRLATMAADRIGDLRQRFPDLDAAAKHLVGQAQGNDWPTFHAGVALALADRRKAAAAMFKRLNADPDDPDWWPEAVDRAHRHAGTLSSKTGGEQFRQEVSEAIRDARTSLKLDPDLELPWEAQATRQ